MKPGSNIKSLIDALPDEFEAVLPPQRKPSVREAILLLREQVGSKVFTKASLTQLLETQFPHLVPVKPNSLDVSLARAKEHLEVRFLNGRNHYRFKK